MPSIDEDDAELSLGDIFTVSVLSLSIYRYWQRLTKYVIFGHVKTFALNIETIRWT